MKYVALLIVASFLQRGHEVCPYRVARRVRHGVVFFTDIQGIVM